MYNQSIVYIVFVCMLCVCVCTLCLCACYVYVCVKENQRKPGHADSVCGRYLARIIGWNACK